MYLLLSIPIILGCLELGSVTCSSWPAPSQTLGCKETRRYAKELDGSMQLSDTARCAEICKLENKNGCCGLDDDGCYWTKGSESSPGFTPGKITTAVNCKFES